MFCLLRGESAGHVILAVNRRQSVLVSVPRVNVAVNATLRVSTQTRNESEMSSSVA
jgi:hypothetical protein